MSLVTIFTGVHKSPHTTPKNSKLANLAIVAVIVLVPLKLIRKNAKCQSYFDIRNAIHDQLGCLEVLGGQNRGQK